MQWCLIFFISETAEGSESDCPGLSSGNEDFPVNTAIPFSPRMSGIDMAAA
jgi:hypothetical protein